MKKNQKLVLLASLFAATTLQAETTFDIGFSAGYKHVKETWTGKNTPATTADHGVTNAGGAATDAGTTARMMKTITGVTVAEGKVYGGTDALSFSIPTEVKSTFKDSFVMLSVPMQMKMDRFGLKLDLGYGIGVKSKISNDAVEFKNNKKSSLFEAALKASYDFNVSESLKIVPFIGYEIQSLKRKVDTSIVHSSVTKDKSTIADSLMNIVSPSGSKSKKNTPVIGVDIKFAPSEDLSIGVSLGYAMPSVCTNGLVDYTSLTDVLGWSATLNPEIINDTEAFAKAALKQKDVYKKRASQFRFGLNIDWMLNQSWALNLFANARTLSAKQTKAYAKQAQGHWTSDASTAADRYAVSMSSGSQAGKFKSNEYTFGLGATYKF